MSLVGISQEGSGALKTSNRLIVMVLAGLVGGGIGFLLSHIPGDGDDLTSLSALRNGTGLWFMFIMVGIGGSLIAGNSYLAGKPPSQEALLVAVPAVLVGGYLSGYVAQMIYTAMQDEAALRSCFESGSSWCSAVAFPRVVAWLVAGGLGGIGVGAAFRSVKRIQNGILGGAAGGLVGGFLFDLVPVVIPGGSEAASQMIGICFIGTLMGLFISLIDAARSAMWLEVVSGEMRGRQFLVMEQTTSVGSARTANVTLLSDRQIKEVHIAIAQTPQGASFTCPTATPVLLNGVTSHGANLSNGDMLRIGNTDVRVGFRHAVGPSGPGLPVQHGGADGSSPRSGGRPPPSEAASGAPGGWSQPPSSSSAPFQAPAGNPMPAAPTSRPRLAAKPPTQ